MNNECQPPSRTLRLLLLCCSVLTWLRLVDGSVGIRFSSQRKMVLPLLFSGLAQRVNLDLGLLIRAVALLRAKGEAARARPLVSRALFDGGLHD